MRTVGLAGLITIIMLALAAACFEQRKTCAQEDQDIVEDIPWSDAERAEYVLLDRLTREECGTGALTVERQGDQFQLTLRFEGDTDSDTSTIMVDDESLQPFSVRRERMIEGEAEAVDGEYDREEDVIRIVEFIDDEPRTVSRELEEDVYYDNESSPFLWRTIRFEEGYEVTYNTVLVNQRGATREVTLLVVGKEQVEVPAGTFDAWRVDISTEFVDQRAFFADTPEHQMVLYDNSAQLFELISFEP